MPELGWDDNHFGEHSLMPGFELRQALDESGDGEVEGVLDDV